MASNKLISTSRKAASKTIFHSILRSLQTKTTQCIYILLAATLVLIVLLSIAITPERYHLQVGDIAYKTITASKDVVDETATAGSVKKPRGWWNQRICIKRVLHPK